MNLLRVSILSLLCVILFSCSSNDGDEFPENPEVNDKGVIIEIDGIYYNITDKVKKEVEVTFKAKYDSPSYSGKIIIPSSITSNGITYTVSSIGKYAFYKCSEVLSITLPSSLKTIDNHAFCGCRGLKSIIIPNSVTVIGGEVFYNCEKLCSVILGSGLLSVGDIFSIRPAKVIWLANTPPDGYEYNAGKMNYVANYDYEFSGVQTIVYNNLNSMFEADNIIYVPVNPAERTCDIIDCSYSEAAKNIKLNRKVSYRGIEMTVNGVQPHAFYNNEFIETLKIDLVGDIPKYAFYGCSNMKNVIVPPSITNIDEYAFSNCLGFTNIELSNTGSIGESAFSGSATSGNGKLAIRSTVKNIEANAFKGCTGLTDIELSNTGSIGESAFSGSATKRNGKLVINSTVTDIIESAFEKCTGLTTVKINNTGDIGDYAFKGCENIEKISIRNDGAVGNYAFMNCSSATSLTIAPTVTRIGDYAFRGCKSIADVVIEDSNISNILTLGSNGNSPLFADCPLDEVYIGRKLSYKTSSGSGYSPFYRNTSLRSVNISDIETKIYDNEFYGCTNLQSVSIGDGVESFGNYAFSGCSKIESFKFGSSVKSIGNEAFSDCTAMTDLYCRAIVPPTCGNQALEDINKWLCTLHVLPEAKAAYMQASQWKDFFFVDGEWNSVDEIEVDGDK